MTLDELQSTMVVAEHYSALLAAYNAIETRDKQEKYALNFQDNLTNSNRVDIPLSVMQNMLFSQIADFKQLLAERGVNA